MASSVKNKDGGNVASLDTQQEEQLHSKSLLEKAIYRILHDRLTMIAGTVLILLTIFCYSAPLIVQITDIDYNNPDLYKSSLPPGAAVVDSDTTVWMWEIETGESRRPFIGHTKPALSIDVATTGRHFLTGTEDGQVRLWHIGSGRTDRLLEEHEGAVRAVAFHPGDELFVTASDDGTAKVWTVRKADRTAPDIPELVFDVSPAAITSVAFNPAGDVMLTGLHDGTLRLWDFATGDQLDLIAAHEGQVNGIAYHPDGERILTAGADGTIGVWTADSDEAVTRYTFCNGTVYDVDYSRDGAYAAAACADNKAVVWQAGSNEVVLTVDGHTGPVRDVSFTPEGERLVTASEDQTARVWDLQSGEQLFNFDDFEHIMYGAEMTEDGEYVLTAMHGRDRYYILGTDTSGRDHLTRLLYGGQISLRIGFFAAIGSLTIGIVVGVMAGYYGGIFDDVIIWMITTLNSIPSLFLLLIISAMLSPNANSLILVLVFLGWTGTTRLVRGETYALREREFIMASRAVGASDVRLMFIHIVPNVISLLLISLTSAIGGLILAESGLSFLGFGVKPPEPTWGNMLSGGLELLREAPHLVFAPGLLITVTVLCLYIVGDGLRDAFDPRTSD